MSAGPRRIEVVIDELILHGFGHQHSHAIAAGLRTELAVALANWRPGASTDIDRLDTGSIRHHGGVPPDAFGQTVARHVARALPTGAAPKGPR